MTSLIEPRHLLNFNVEGNPDLENFYRDLVPVTDDHKDDVKSSLGCCAECNAVLSVEDRPRLKPPRGMTRTIQKLMTKSAKKIPLNRFENFKLKKFLTSSQEMVVKCSQCDFVNKKPVIGREDLIKLKEKRLLAVENAEREPLEIEETPEVEKSKKRKRKKKKKKESRRNPNSLISDEEEEKDESSSTSILTPTTPSPITETSTPSTSKKKDVAVSLRNFIKSETKDTSSSAIFQRAINANARTPISQTPVSSSNKSNVKLNQSAKSAAPVRRKSIHKQLRLFLSGKPQESENNKSLHDFLTLL